MQRLFLLLSFTGIAVFLCIGYFHPITALNQDLGRHLITGNLILETLRVPSINLYAYTFPTFPFINHHWLSEVFFSLIYQGFGFPGLFVFWLSLIFCAVTFIIVRAQRYVSPFLLFPVAILYLRILFERTELRPEGLSFFFLSAIVTLLYTYRERFTRLVFLIIPLQLLWTNSHIYFPLGIVVLILFCIDQTVTNRSHLKDKKLLTLYGTTLLAGLATLMNPNGLSGALYPLRVFQNYGYTIVENQTPFLLQQLGRAPASFPYLEIATLLLFTCLFIAVKKTRIIDWLLAIVFTFIAYSAVRNFPLFVFTTFIPLCYSLGVISPLLKKHVSFLSLPLIKILTLLLFTGVFIWQITDLTKTYPVTYAVYEDGKGALDFFMKNKLHGPIFNNFDIGSYIESRLYPQEKVFIDGRPEAYPASFIQNTYIKMQEDPSLFKKVSEQYNFQSIVFSHTDQTPWGETFIQQIVHNPQWSVVYLDPTMIILIKKTEEHRNLITQFGMDPQNLVMNHTMTERELRMATHFFSIINNRKQLQSLLEQLVKLNPKDCSIMESLTTLYYQDQHPLANAFIQRFQSRCR